MSDDDRMDPVQRQIELEDEAEREALEAASSVHDGPLLAFATNFELVKKLTHIIGWEKIPAEGRQLMFNYLSALVDGADGFVEAEVAGSPHTTELTTLFREFDEARNWLAAHMEIE